MFAIEERLRMTRFRDGNGNLSGPNVNSSAIFTIMVQGLPKSLGDDGVVLHEYFQHRYPGKVYKVTVPMDICTLDDLATELVRVRDEITWLVARIDSRLLPEENYDDVARIINAEAMAWVQSSSWLASLIFQFLPNVIIFVSMYVIVPSALSYLSKFERHLTVYGEQKAALLKMVCFFLVNLMLLRALVESSLEGAILDMLLGWRGLQKDRAIYV